jgi:hypothetical protein
MTGKAVFTPQMACQKMMVANDLAQKSMTV